MWTLSISLNAVSGKAGDVKRDLNGACTDGFVIDSMQLCYLHLWCGARFNFITIVNIITFFVIFILTTILTIIIIIITITNKITSPLAEAA